MKENKSTQRMIGTNRTRHCEDYSIDRASFDCFSVLQEENSYILKAKQFVLEQNKAEIRSIIYLLKLKSYFFLKDVIKCTITSYDHDLITMTYRWSFSRHLRLRKACAVEYIE